jgi:hypothetical protein
MPETLLLNKKSLSPILLVLIWTRIALYRLIKFSCTRKMRLIGSNVYFRVNRPFVSFCHSNAHLLFAFLYIQILRVAFSVNSSSGVFAFGPGFPDFLHPVASLAALSAASLPGIPSCANIQ